LGIILLKQGKMMLCNKDVRLWTQIILQLLCQMFVN